MTGESKRMKRIHDDIRGATTVILRIALEAGLDGEVPASTVNLIARQCNEIERRLDEARDA